MNVSVMMVMMYVSVMMVMMYVPVDDDDVSCMFL